MASGNIVADGPTTFQSVAGEAVHLALLGDFGGGTIAVEQEVNGTPGPLLSDGVAITFTSNADVRLNTVAGDKIRLNMSGATAPDLDFNLAGASLIFTL